MLTLGLVVVSQPATADPADVGVEGPSHTGTSTPTGTKRAESVLWFNDGHWWGNLWDTVTSDFHIFRFDARAQSWVDTGVTSETRAETHHDVLWDGTTLYIASHKFVKDGVAAGSGYPSTLYRYGYDPRTETYTSLGSTQINNYRTETLVIDKDTTGRLWATWQQGNKIYLNVTATDGKTWGSPFPHPASADASSTANVTIDDTSALIAHGPGKMGLMWSRQMGDATDGFYWSVHEDGASPTTWSTPAAITAGQKSGDDHMNLRWLDSSGGRVFAAVKTSFTGGTQPQIQLLSMASDGAWAPPTTIARVSECPNRVILIIDERQQRLRTFATYPKPSGTTNAGVCSTSGGAIYEKSTPLENINFSAEKTLRILDADQYVHNVSSTKQNVNNNRTDGASTTGSGVLVIADVNATSRYWHHYDNVAGDTTPPSVTTVTPAEGATGVPVASDVTGTFSEAMDPSTVSGTTIRLTDSAGSAVSATVTYDAATSAVRLDPAADLTGSGTYTATIAGGATGVKDTAGNPLTTDKTWSFTTAASTEVLLQDGFESGGLSAWTVRTGADGTASVQSDVVKEGGFAVRLSATSSTGSRSYLRHTFSTGLQELTLVQDVQVAAEGSSGGNVPLLRLFDDGGTRVLSLHRQNASGDKVYVSYGGTAYLTSGRLPLGSWTRVEVHVKLNGSGSSRVEVLINGQAVHSSTIATVATALRTMQIGNETAKQPFVLYADNVMVSRPVA